MEKYRDSDYLFLTTRLRSLENNLLTQDRMEQMLEARNNVEAMRVLEDCGYPEPEHLTPEGIDALLAEDREKVTEDMRLLLPNPAILEVFQTKYDYHNVKAILKAPLAAEDPERLLVDLGRVDPERLRESIRGSQYSILPEDLGQAIPAARQLLAEGATPQQMEFFLDRACFAEMLRAAFQEGSDFLEGYVRRLIDGVNLRSAVRGLRMGREPEFLESVLLEGGTVDPKAILNVVGASGSLEEVFDGIFQEAAEAGTEAAKGGPLTRFEKLCDDAVTAYTAEARFVAFGEAPVVSYLAAKQTEYTAIRILMLGRMAGLAPETIRERLREIHV